MLQVGFILEFTHLEDLMDIVKRMIDLRLLVGKPYLPLELIEFRALPITLQERLIVHNKCITQDFILNNKKWINFKLLIQHHKVTMNTFNRLGYGFQQILIRNHSPNLMIQVLFLFKQLPTMRQYEIARYQLTEQEIEYIILHGAGFRDLFHDLLVYQNITQHHIEMMERKNIRALNALLSLTRCVIQST
jgi:hypothetical protein